MIPTGTLPEGSTPILPTRQESTMTIDIETARSIVAEIESGTVYEDAPRAYSSEEAHAWAAGVEYGMAVAAAIATTAPAQLRKSGTVQLNPADPDSVFEVTQADVTFNAADHVSGRHELNIVLVLERDIPARDSGIRTSATECKA